MLRESIDDARRWATGFKLGLDSKIPDKSSDPQSLSSLSRRLSMRLVRDTQCPALHSHNRFRMLDLPVRQQHPALRPHFSMPVERHPQV